MGNLKIRRCPMVTERSRVRLAEKCHHIHTLEISNFDINRSLLTLFSNIGLIISWMIRIIQLYPLISKWSPCLYFYCTISFWSVFIPVEWSQLVARHQCGQRITYKSIYKHGYFRLFSFLIQIFVSFENDCWKIM